MSIEAECSDLDGCNTHHRDDPNHHHHDISHTHPFDDIGHAHKNMLQDDRVLLARQVCVHGREWRHKSKPKEGCSECGGKGTVTGHSGSDAFTDDCFCITTCRGGTLVQVWPEVSE